MDSARSTSRYTYAEYLTFERDSALKHEWVDGAILGMAGGSRRHNALALRVGAALEAGRRAGCVAFQSDQRVRILATGRSTYPDLSAVCGPIEGDPEDPSGVTITNPALKAMTGGNFKSETLPVSVVGMNQVKVQQMLDRVGFK